MAAIRRHQAADASKPGTGSPHMTLPTSPPRRSPRRWAPPPAPAGTWSRRCGPCQARRRRQTSGRGWVCRPLQGEEKARPLAWHETGRHGMQTTGVRSVWPPATAWLPHGAQGWRAACSTIACSAAPAGHACRCPCSARRSMLGTQSVWQAVTHLLRRSSARTRGWTRCTLQSAQKVQALDSRLAMARVSEPAACMHLTACLPDKPMPHHTRQHWVLPPPTLQPAWQPPTDLVLCALDLSHRLDLLPRRAAPAVGSVRLHQRLLVPAAARVPGGLLGAQLTLSFEGRQAAPAAVCSRFFQCLPLPQTPGRQQWVRT